MVDYAKINEVLERSAEEARRYLRAEGAAAERARCLRIAAEIRDGLPLGDARRACGDIIIAIMQNDKRGDHAQPEPA